MSLQYISKRKPLIHCITNTVVSNFTANGLLAIGASPIMADAIEEVAEIVNIADGLLINIGTLNERTVASMKVAIKSANVKGIPTVLDPVGAGATSYRLQTARYFLEEAQVTLLRCNAGELAAIAGANWQANGVDSGQGEADIEMLAKEVATRYACFVIVTGEQDLLTDGQQVEYVVGGHVNVTKITGTGCLLSAICAALLASTSNPMNDLKNLLAEYKQAAKKAVAPIGTFQIQLLNELERMAEVTV